MIAIRLICLALITWSSASFSATKVNFKPNISFVVETSIPAVSVEGELKGDAKFEAEIHEEGAKKLLKNIVVTIPVSSLSTGMGVRDTHMYEKIFSGKDKVIEFVSTGVCDLAESSCKLPGVMTISGNKSNLTLNLTNIQFKGNQVSAKSEVVVKLDEYKIVAPDYMGVTVENKVDLKINLVQK
jgi:polyisoprenoid-binding protein YceI